RIVPVGQLQIDGNKLVCGQRPTVLDLAKSLHVDLELSSVQTHRPRTDISGTRRRSRRQARAAYPGFLILNPQLLAKISTAVKLWIYSHECGHQFRGPDEETADCFAVQRGR